MQIDSNQRECFGDLFVVMLYIANNMKNSTFPSHSNALVCMLQSVQSLQVLFSYNGIRRIVFKQSDEEEDQISTRKYEITEENWK